MAQSSYWGLLIPNKKEEILRTFKGLCRESFSIGKGANNDYIITNQQAEQKVLDRISKNHCLITKDCSSDGSPVYIKDLSLNGTFVNGELIGLNKKRILKTLDLISFNLPMFKFFEFINPRGQNHSVAEEIYQQYHIETEGCTGFAKTLKVIDRKTFKTFAMKIIRRNKYREPSVVADDIITREVEIMKKLAHRNIIICNNFTINEHNIYMFHDYMEGGNLSQRIERDKYLSVNTTKHFFLQLCAAVNYLHDKSYIHRDINLDNILLQSEDEFTELKLSEFLVTKIVVKEQTYYDGLIRPCMSPEIQNKLSSAQCTNKVDIWSLGVVLYSMFCGRLPFVDTENGKALKHIFAGKFHFEHPEFRHVPESAKQLIQKMLTVDENQRPTINEVLMHPWLKDEDPDLTENEIFDRKIIHINPPPKRQRNE